ncbi:LysR family transcriptional regulator [Sorangium sp. So ce1335]|uniref:LysR family transcriptional regulator n=1 Tax=Sorangium sp. So ce1335 TaxID=3133335 RepID=UPI003F5E2734
MDAQIDLDLNDAALLVRVVRTRSFSAAARERGVPVSTVSRRIARLEAALGVRLLERTTRRLQLTDAGRAYFGHAERAIDDLAQGTHLVRELQSEPRGRVRVVAPIALGATVARVVCAYLAKHPRVSVDLEIDSRPVDLLAGRFDIAIVPGRVDDTTDFVARELWRATRKLLYASPRYLEARGVPRRVEDLARHDCIAVHATEGMATWTLGQGRRRRRIVFEPRFYVSESSAAHRATLAGIGIALLPEVFCAEDVAAKRLVRVLDGHEAEAGGVSLLYRAHRALTAAVRTCVDHLLGELPATDPVRAGRGRRP